VVGRAGGGTSTLLGDLAHELASGGNRWSRRWVPLIADVHPGVDASHEPEPASVEQLLERTLPRPRRSQPGRWVRALLARGGAAVLVDGFDSLSSAARASLLDGLAARAGQGNLVVMTARARDAFEGSAAVVLLHVQALCERQVATITQRRGADPGLLQQVSRSPALVRMAGEPALLDMMVEVHAAHGQLPGSRTGLLSAYCDLHLSAAQRVEARRLAHVLVTATETTGDLPTMTGDLFATGTSGAPRFRSNLVRDHLCAEHVHFSGGDSTTHLRDPAWQEVLVSCSGLGDAADIVTACLAGQQSGDLLVLAARCADQAGPLRADLAAAVRERVSMPGRSSAMALRPAAAEALLRMRELEDAPLGVGRFVASTGVSWDEYALFLRSCTTTDSSPLPGNGWHSRPEDPVRGLRHEDARAFCRFLTRRLDNGYVYRLPTPEELEAAADAAIAGVEETHLTPRSWCGTLVFGVPETTALACLRSLTQKARFDVHPALADQSWPARLVAQLEEDLEALGVGPLWPCHELVTAALTTGSPARHGCDLDDVAQTLEAAASSLAEARRALRSDPVLDGSPFLLEELDAAAAWLRGGAPEDDVAGPTAVEARQRARLVCLREWGRCLDAAGDRAPHVPSQRGHRPDAAEVVGGLCAGLHEAYVELAGFELALQDHSSALPELRYVRTASGSGGAELDVALAGLDPGRTAWTVTKALVDRGVAAGLLLLLGPLLLLAAIAIRATGRGPVLFAQTRVGRRGRLFTVLKFRTMNGGTAAGTADLGVLFKSAADPRVSRVGGVLRRSSLDELPQLLNVLSGSMSLVGPRPLVVSETAQLGERALQRLLVKPGLTGLWQVEGRSDLGWNQSVALDVYYALHCSPALDLRILAATPRAVFTARGAY
jgi:lipopolysaccharide/colanic/teichoic acid biosynthesis glycosyltransferase